MRIRRGNMFIDIEAQAGPGQRYMRRYLNINCIKAVVPFPEDDKLSYVYLTDEGGRMLAKASFEQMKELIKEAAKS